jgi:hypothetical protein
MRGDSSILSLLAMVLLLAFAFSIWLILYGLSK